MHSISIVHFIFKSAKTVTMVTTHIGDKHKHIFTLTTFVQKIFVVWHLSQGKKFISCCYANIFECGRYTCWQNELLFSKYIEISILYQWLITLIISPTVIYLLFRQMIIQKCSFLFHNSYDVSLSIDHSNSLHQQYDARSFNVWFHSLTSESGNFKHFYCREKKRTL